MVKKPKFWKPANRFIELMHKVRTVTKAAGIIHAILNIFLSAHPSIEKPLELLFISSHVKTITHKSSARV